jgi:hypothetical protein
MTLALGVGHVFLAGAIAIALVAIGVLADEVWHWKHPRRH